MVTKSDLAALIMMRLSRAISRSRPALCLASKGF